MIEFLVSVEKALPVLLAIFVTVFVLILGTRIVFKVLLHFAKKKYQKLKNIKKLFKSNKNFNTEDSELLRKLDIPQAHSAVRAQNMTAKNNQNQSYELIPSNEQQIAKEEMNETKIVDIVKPIGFWTSMILGQKLTYLIQSAQVINKRDRQGFWVSMIEAQERAAGRQHGRTR